MEPAFREPSELIPRFRPETPPVPAELGVPAEVPAEVSGKEQPAVERERVEKTGEVHHEVHEKHPLPVKIAPEHQAHELEKIIASGGVEVNPQKEGKHPVDVTNDLIEIKDWTSSN